MIFKQWRINKEAQALHYAKIERLLEENNLKLAQIEARLILIKEKYEVKIC